MAAAWKKSPGGAADFDAAFTTLSPIELVTEFEGLGGAIRRTGTETRNGRRTIHYRADAGDAVATEAGLSKGAIDAWFAASGGYLVGLVIDGTWDLDGTPTRVVLRIDVSRVNDRGNSDHCLRDRALAALLIPASGNGYLPVTAREEVPAIVPAWISLPRDTLSRSRRRRPGRSIRRGSDGPITARSGTSRSGSPRPAPTTRSPIASCSSSTTRS